MYLRFNIILLISFSYHFLGNIITNLKEFSKLIPHVKQIKNLYYYKFNERKQSFILRVYNKRENVKSYNKS